MLRHEIARLTLLSLQLPEVHSPSRPYNLPLWAQRQVEADAEGSTSESSNDKALHRLAPQTYFNDSTEVDNVYTRDDSYSAG